MRLFEPWRVDGDEADPRWSLANERTLLAYSRTALGLVVAGLAIAGSQDHKPLLGADTAVVSLQNGVDHEERIAGHIGARHVVGGVALIFSTIAAPGVIDQTGGPARFIVGELDGRASPRLDRLRAVCEAAGVDLQLSGDIRAALWRKFAFICAQPGLTAATRLPLGDIRADDAAWSLFRTVTAEVCAVAAAEGVALPAGTADELVTMAAGADPANFWSLHYDLTRGKPMEPEALHGTVVRLARRHGVACRPTRRSTPCCHRWRGATPAEPRRPAPGLRACRARRDAGSRTSTRHQAGVATPPSTTSSASPHPCPSSTQRLPPPPARTRPRRPP